MKGFVIGCLSFVFFLLGGAEKDRLAVMDVADEAKLFNKTTIANVTDYIFTKLQGTKIYWMVPKADRDTALEQAIEETVKGSRRECVDEKCQLSLVAQLQANFLINTKIKKLYEGTCNISISKFDVEKRAGVDSWEAKFNCTEKGLYETIDGFDFDGNKDNKRVLKQDKMADENACKYAKEKDDPKIWQEYLKEYPGGVCVFEAKNKIRDKGELLVLDIYSDDNYEETLKKLNGLSWDEMNKNAKFIVTQTVDFLRKAECFKVEDEKYAYNKLTQTVKKMKYVWEKMDSLVVRSSVSENSVKEERGAALVLLKTEWDKFKGKCVKGYEKTYKKLNWSKKASDKMNWNDAKKYCEDLVEDGYSDWRLPTISELRTLIKNCPTTEIGGACKVTKECLFWQECRNNSCEGCSGFSDGRYSKFDDTGWFWSSSELPDSLFKGNSWKLNFDDGSINTNSKDKYYKVRCFR
jgi:hypothetical protein